MEGWESEEGWECEERECGGAGVEEGRVEGWECGGVGVWSSKEGCGGVACIPTVLVEVCGC